MHTKKLSEKTKDDLIAIIFSIVLGLALFLSMFMPVYRINKYTEDFKNHNLITKDNKINENSKSMNLEYLKDSDYAFKNINSYSSDELLQIYPKLLCQYDKICVTILLISRSENDKIKEQIRDCNLYLDKKLPIKDEMRIKKLKRKISNSDTFSNNKKELKDEIYRRMSLDPKYSELNK
jgi:hypothetical protein